MAKQERDVQDIMQDVENAERAREFAPSCSDIPFSPPGAIVQAPEAQSDAEGREWWYGLDQQSLFKGDPYHGDSLKLAAKVIAREAGVSLEELGEPIFGPVIHRRDHRG